MEGDQEGSYKEELEETLDEPSYSQLLFADDDITGVATLDGCFNFNTTSSNNSQRMLCFGTHDDDYMTTKTCDTNGSITPLVDTNCYINTPTRTQKSGVTCSSTGDSPSISSSTSKPKITTSSNKSNKRRKGTAKESVEKTNAGNQRNCTKRTKAENSNVTGHAKVKKEKLGERITALQQLVSPFGKTDTASVLHEAMGYIRFLHDQIQVLCSPYLQRLSPSLREGGESRGNKEMMLRSKGLCLVPVELTLHVADTPLNGADFWSPAAMINNNNNNLPSNQ